MTTTEKITKVERQITQLKKELKQLKYIAKLEQQQEDLKKFYDFYNWNIENDHKVSEIKQITGEQKGHHFIQYYFYNYFYFENGAPLKINQKRETQKHSIKVYID